MGVTRHLASVTEALWPPRSVLLQLVASVLLREIQVVTLLSGLEELGQVKVNEKLVFLEEVARNWELLV
jgi:hypothetical protein